jgi:hypothetical protein
MKFEPGDIVSLNADDRRLVVVSRMDSRLLWVRLLHSDRADMYAFCADDLRLIARSQPVEPTTFTTVPQIPRADSGSIAA